MSVNVRWRIIDGKPFVSIGLPGAFVAAITTTDAWELLHELQRVLPTRPPDQPDNGEREN